MPERERATRHGTVARKRCGHPPGYRCACRLDHQQREDDECDCVDFMRRNATRFARLDDA